MTLTADLRTEHSECMAVSLIVMYSPPYAFYTVYTLYTFHYILYILHNLYSLNSTYSIVYSIYSLHSIIYSMQAILYIFYYILYTFSIQLTLEQHGFELRKSAIMRVFFNKHILQYYMIHSWLNLRMWNCGYGGGLTVKLYVDFQLRRESALSEGQLYSLYFTVHIHSIIYPLYTFYFIRYPFCHLNFLYSKHSIIYSIHSVVYIQSGTGGTYHPYFRDTLLYTTGYHVPHLGSILHRPRPRRTVQQTQKDCSHFSFQSYSSETLM